MGVQDLSKELRASGSLVSKLSELSGKILGVDTSAWLNKAIFSCPEFCHYFHQEPQVTVQPIIESYLNSMLSIFTSNNIKLLFVLDGARNPLKASTNERRKSKSDLAKAEMIKLINTLDPENIKLINQFKKKAVYVREDVVAGFISWCHKKSLTYVCAFMEAEWELSKLEADGIIDGVVSEDSDCLVLGCKLVVQLLNKGADPLGFNCSFVRRETWVSLVTDTLQGASISELTDFAVLLGVDYLERANGNSLKKIQTFFTEWRTNKSSILSQIETNGKVGLKRPGTGLPNYSTTFQHASNLFQFAPCFVISSLTQGNSLRDAFWNGDYSVCLGNIRSLPNSSTQTSLFGFDPSEYLPSDILILDLFTMKKWIRTRSSIADYAIPQPKNAANEDLPWGCYLDFEKVPVIMQPISALISYLECRGLSPKSSTTRDQINAAVERVSSQRDSGAAIIPILKDNAGGHYVNLEVLTCGSPLVWEVDSSIVFNYIRDVPTVFDEDFINKHFGAGRNGVRERAWRRVHAGHFDLRTFQSADCKRQNSDGIADVRIYSIKCTPSMKKDVYTVYIILRVCDGTFLSTPASRCNCPVGRLFCSHMLAFIVLLEMMKSLTVDENWEWFVLNMPEPVKSLHSICIPMEYVF